MKKCILSLALAVLMLTVAVPMVSVPAYAATITFSGGAGTEADPYIITTAEQLEAISLDLFAGNTDYSGKHYKLGNDIDLSAYGKDYSNPWGKGWYSIGTEKNPFTGVFDGNNKKITGLYIDLENRGWSSGGLFLCIEGGTVKNLGLVNVNINATSSRPVGGITAFLNKGSTIENCYVTGTVKNGSGPAGGIAGNVTATSGEVTIANKAGQPYAVYNFEAVSTLSMEETAAARAFGAKFMEILNAADVEPIAEAV